MAKRDATIHCPRLLSCPFYSTSFRSFMKPNEPTGIANPCPPLSQGTSFFISIQPAINYDLTSTAPFLQTVVLEVLPEIEQMGVLRVRGPKDKIAYDKPDSKKRFLLPFHAPFNCHVAIDNRNQCSRLKFYRISRAYTPWVSRMRTHGLPYSRQASK